MATRTPESCALEVAAVLRGAPGIEAATVS